MAEVTGVGHAFGQLQVLQSVEMKIGAGQVLGILGPNGAGKTTLINLLLGVYTPKTGDISVLGHSPGTLPVRQRIGVMLQQAELAETLKVHELIRQFACYYPKPLPVDQLLKMAGLEDKAEERYGKLSGGQKRRVQFAIALAGEPDILFLDEPTTGLDVQARRTLWASIRDYARRGAAVVLTTHYLEEADALSDQIVVLNRGRIVAGGSPAQIKQRVSLKQIRCRTSVPLEQLQAHPLVESAELDARVFSDTSQTDEYLLLTHNAEGLLRDLLTQDQSLSDLRVTGAGLEEAFLALTEDEEQNTEQAA